MRLLERGTASLLDSRRKRPGGHVAVASKAFGDDERLGDGGMLARPAAPEGARPEFAESLTVERSDGFRGRTAGAELHEFVESEVFGHWRARRLPPVHYARFSAWRPRTNVAAAPHQS